MPDKKRNSEVGEAVRANFKVGGRVYEQRWVRCGKQKCWCSGERRDGHFGHGPYWYLCGMRKSRWTRVYLGKDVDTRRFAAPDGSIDWDEVDKRFKNVLQITEGDGEGVEDGREDEIESSKGRLVGQKRNAREVVESGVHSA